MGLGAFEAFQLLQGVRQPHQDQVRSPVGMDAEIVILRLHRPDRRAAQFGRQAVGEAGGGGAGGRRMGLDRLRPGHEDVDGAQDAGDGQHRTDHQRQGRQRIHVSFEHQAGDEPDQNRDRAGDRPGQGRHREPRPLVHVDPAIDQQRADLPPHRPRQHHRHPVDEPHPEGRIDGVERPGQRQNGPGRRGDGQAPRESHHDGARR